MMNLRLDNLNHSFESLLISKGILTNSNYRARVDSESVELVLFDEQDKRVFGASIQLYFFARYDEQAKLELNTGSMGTFDLSCIASVAKYTAMSELIKNFDKLELLVDVSTILYKQITK